jgi:hypothetical protein
MLCLSLSVSDRLCLHESEMHPKSFLFNFWGVVHCFDAACLFTLLLMHGCELCGMLCNNG